MSQFKIFQWLPITFRAKSTLLPEVYKAVCAPAGRSCTHTVPSPWKTLSPDSLQALSHHSGLSLMATSSERSSMMFQSRHPPPIPIDHLCHVSFRALTYLFVSLCVVYSHTH